MISWKFDFGGGSPCEGYQGVDISTDFNPHRRFGWVTAKQLQTRDRNIDDQVLGRFVCGSEPATFAVLLSPGRYRLRILMGDKDHSNHVLQVGVSNTDILFPLLTADAGEYAILNTAVDVTSEFAGLIFSSPTSNWVVNAVLLEIDVGRERSDTYVEHRKFNEPFDDGGYSERIPAELAVDKVLDYNAAFGGTLSPIKVASAEIIDPRESVEPSSDDHRSIKPQDVDANFATEGQYQGDIAYDRMVYKTPALSSTADPLTKAVNVARQWLRRGFGV